MTDLRIDDAWLEEFVVDTTKELVGIRTVNYREEDFPDKGPDGMESPGEESKVVEVVARIFDAHGIPYEVHGDAPRQDIVGVVGRQEEGYRRLIIPTHSDVVPAGKGWTEISDPFTAELKDGYLIGRGVMDNKGPMAAALAQAIVLKKHEDKLPGAVLFAMVQDEEVGQSKGLKDLVLSGKINATDAIVPDVGENLAYIVSAEKGVLHLNVTVKGKQGHGSMPHLGLNAINGLAEYVRILEPYTATPPRGSFLGQRYSLDQRFEEGVTVNVGTFSGGDAVNMVAAEAKAGLDIRFVPELEGEQVMKLLYGAAESLKARGYEVEFQVNADMLPHSVPDDAAVIQAIQKYADAPTKGIGGRTVCGPLQAGGVTSVGWGPGDEEYFHVADERIAVKALTDFGKIGAEVGRHVAQQRVD